MEQFEFALLLLGKRVWRRAVDGRPGGHGTRQDTRVEMEAERAKIGDWDHIVCELNETKM